MMRTQIYLRIKAMFKEVLFRDLEKCDNAMKESIFGDKIALLPAEAYYLLICLEKEFNIEFPNEVVINYRFQTIENIVDEIEKVL